tara:strand:+ start:7621 stop:8598 length:978 start_codon:yes stop_codon:yes gene_type:complete
LIDFILSEEPKIRLISFLGIFTFMAVVETLWPRKKRVDSRKNRWTSNFGIVFVSSIAANLFFKFLFIGTLVQFASMIRDKGWGLFNYFADSSVQMSSGAEWLLILKGIIVMDLIIYFQHRFSHSNKYIWDMHKVHHADLDLDVTSGNRFHPVEILFSLLVKIVSITVLGIHPVSMIIFEVVLNGMAQWNHSNFKLPLWIDKYVRFLIVTPDFHRVHHSVHVKETNSNYGFNLSWWDYMFGTYQGQPRDGHENMKLGLNEYRDPKQLRLIDLFLIPYDQKTLAYAHASNKEEIIFDSKEKIIHPPNDPSFHEKNRVAYDKEKIDSS